MACSRCATGQLREDETLCGRIEKLHGLSTYITEPPPGQSLRGMIVILPDGCGWNLPDTRAPADIYARRAGRCVYLPDLQARHAVPTFVVHGSSFLAQPQSWRDLPWKV